LKTSSAQLQGSGATSLVSSVGSSIEKKSSTTSKAINFPLRLQTWQTAPSPIHPSILNKESPVFYLPAYQNPSDTHPKQLNHPFISISNCNFCFGIVAFQKTFKNCTANNRHTWKTKEAYKNTKKRKEKKSQFKHTP